MEVTGRNLLTGLPKTVQVGSDEMIDALNEPVQAILEAIHNLLERTPPELSADIYEQDVYKRQTMTSPSGCCAISCARWWGGGSFSGRALWCACPAA